MSWLRRGAAGAAPGAARVQHDPAVCLQTFAKHWQHALHIMDHEQGGGGECQQDAVLGVVSHVEQTAVLLELEARALPPDAAPPAPCFAHLLDQQLPAALHRWSLSTGRYWSAAAGAQVRLHAALVRAHGPAALAAPAARDPLHALLRALAADLQPPHLQEELVSLLGQMCVVLVQRLDLLDNWFFSDERGEQCLLVRLLLSSAHAEGGAGAAARHGLLLVAQMSAAHARLAAALLPPAGDACVVLATGLSGLYSLLPRAAPAAPARLSTDHVAAASRLALLVDSLEFCDAAAQAAAPAVRAHLLHLFYHGFLVPVLGPALLQTSASSARAATLYLEVCVRCVSARGLLPPLLRFLLRHEYDGVRLLDTVLARLANAPPPLALASLALLDTLLDLHCQDVLLRLVPGCGRQSWCPAESFRAGAAALLALAPRAALLPLEKPRESLLGDYRAYLSAARHELSARAAASAAWAPSAPAGYAAGRADSGYLTMPHADDARDCAEDSFWSEVAAEDEGDAAGEGAAACDEAADEGRVVRALLQRAECLLQAELPAALLLTGVLSKLAAQPAPRLASLLLTPAPRGLLQVLARLRREADAATAACGDRAALVRRARAFLVARELGAHAAAPAPPSAAPPPARRSLSSALSSMFGRRGSAVAGAADAGAADAAAEGEQYWAESVSRRAVLNALVLAEWTRELAALACEHALRAAPRRPRAPHTHTHTLEYNVR